jgi:hypothetical protein
MNNTIDILTKEFEALKADLIAKHDELGMRASGNWADSLEVVVSENKAQLFGAKYSEQLEFGRKPGGSTGTGTSFSEAIEQWIRDKGIANRIEGEISVSSLAFLIVRKIMREGWKREEHGGVELISQVVTPERIQSILDKISDIYVVDFTNDLIELLKQAA